MRGPRPAGQRQLVAAAWDATSRGGGGALPPPWHRQAPRLGRVGRPQWGADIQLEAVPAPACGWGGKAANFSSLGPFSGRSWTHCQRFLFATRKQKKISSPAHATSLAAIPLLSSSSHYSCLLIHSIHLPIRSPSIHPLSIFPSIHVCMHQFTHSPISHLSPSHPFIYPSFIHHSTHLSSVLPPIHPSMYSGPQGGWSHVGNPTWTRCNCH